MKRTAVSKKIRFEIFKRDNFTCAYCGSKPPKTVLEVDHILPVSKGGTNVLDNLITSCFDCNRGKSDRDLTAVPKTIQEKSEILKQKNLQYKQYIKHTKELEEHNQRLVDMVEDVYQSYYPDYHFSKSFRLSILMFINKLPLDLVMEAMRVSCSKFNHLESTRYFCGICWNKIKENV